MGNATRRKAYDEAKARFMRLREITGRLGRKSPSTSSLLYAYRAWKGIHTGFTHERSVAEMVSTCQFLGIVDKDYLREQYGIRL